LAREKSDKAHFRQRTLHTYATSTDPISQKVEHELDRTDQYQVKLLPGTMSKNVAKSKGADGIKSILIG